jgi:hypothetical protein
MYITCKKSTANPKLIGNLIVSPDTLTLSMASSADLTTESGSLWIEAAIDCLRAFSDGMNGVECRHTKFNSHIQI